MFTATLHRIFTISFAVLAAIAALAFSVVVFTGIAVLGVIAFTYAWWRNKFGLARPRGAAAPRATRAHGEIIDLPSREVERPGGQQIDRL